MKINTRYYRADFIQQIVQPEAGGFTTAAMKHCMGCRCLIDGMGGGDDFICAPCLHALRSGELAREFRATHNKGGE